MVLHLSRERSDVLDISNLTKKSMGSQAIRKDKFGSFMTGEVCFKCFLLQMYKDYLPVVNHSCIKSVQANIAFFASKNQADNLSLVFCF